MSTKAPRPVESERKRIGEMLVEEGLISEIQLKQALEAQSQHGGKLVENLIKLNCLDIRTFVNFVSRQPGIASIDLSHYQVPRDLVKLIPREFAVKHEVFPIDRLGKLLTVGMVCPLDRATLSELESLTGLRVKALLCSAEDIHATIKLYYPEEGHQASAVESFQQLGSALRIENVASLIRRIDALPALPMTVQRIKDLMDDPEVPLHEVANVISMDPPVCARVLKLANSAAYGFSRKVDNADLALSLLGLKEIYMIVLSSAVVDQFKDTSTFDYDAFWKASLFCATASKEIALACGRGKKAGAFTQGLLADIGRLAFMEVATEKYATIPRNLTDAELVSAEERTFGIAHSEAGYVLAHHWELPEDLATAIRFHHAPHMANAHKETVAVVALATRMAEMFRLGFKGSFQTEDDLLKPLNFDAAEAHEIFERAKANVPTDFR